MHESKVVQRWSMYMFIIKSVMVQSLLFLISLTFTFTLLYVDFCYGKVTGLRV